MNQWTSLQNVRSTLEKKWERGIILQEALFPKDLFPLRISLRGPTAAELSDHFSEAREWVSQFINEDKKPFIGIQWDQINNRVLGVNEIPVAVQFDSSEQLVKYLGKTRGFELFSKLADQILDPFPQLNFGCIKILCLYWNLLLYGRNLSGLSTGLKRIQSPGSISVK